MTIALQQELKKLRSQAAELAGLCSAIQEEQRTVQRRLAAEQKTLAQLNSRIAEIEEQMRAAPEPTVTEHALLRYCERVLGVDLAAASSAILNAPTVAAIKFAKNGKHKRADCVVVFKNNAVVTVEPA